jgi:hypothetical protein
MSIKGGLIAASIPDAERSKNVACRAPASLRELDSGLDDWYRGSGARSLDLVILSNYSRRCARHACSKSGDDVGRTPRSDPIFGVQDSDPQKGEPLILWAFGVVRALLDAPQFLCLLRIPGQAARAAKSDIHMFSRICVSEAHPNVMVELGYLGARPIGEEPKRRVGFNFQRLNRSRMELAFASNCRKKRDSNISNYPGQLRQVAR